mmetsp:Transcript_20717/g.61878  ORF Transcript_20717/g.61878 Transcript_20717/m.61878 type:complete len:82 (-) Transcript_20717:279-524(-)
MVGMGHAGQMRRRAQSQALLQSHSAPHALVLPWVPSPLPLLLLVLLVCLLFLLLLLLCASCMRLPGVPHLPLCHCCLLSVR